MDTAKILVVDDEKGICDNVLKILAKKNYQVTQALSAKEALEKMAKESFSLLISDIVMPGTNGLELLRLAKDQWPLTKVIIMTAYASTETAMKAIRLGALDYIPKPFTPSELRATVEKALSGELAEAKVSEKERKSISLIDMDIPFDRAEVAKAAGEEYVDRLGPSDMPIIEMPSPETLGFYCKVGEKVCDIYKKLGNTCKAGLKSNECPQAKKAAKGQKPVQKQKSLGSPNLIGIDHPFSYEEVVSVTGPEYVQNLRSDGFAFVPYEELKKRVAQNSDKARKTIDVDVPFVREEVAAYAGDVYADSLGPSDMPAVSMPSPETLEFYCKVGEKVCDIYKKLGNTCKAGLKSNECPQMKGKKKASGKREATADARRLIGADMPFDYQEVVSATGSEYVRYLQQDGISLVPYEELKKSVSAIYKKEAPRKAVVRELPRRAAREDILVIDDEAAVNNNIRKILVKKGYHVEQAMSKEEALSAIAIRTYGLVLLDLKIPGVQGLELLNAIREKSPETLVIIITGYASIETAKESARIGAIDYLRKPFTPDEIRIVTENAISLAA